jgi:hypothetical protein
MFNKVLINLDFIHIVKHIKTNKKRKMIWISFYYFEIIVRPAFVVGI